MTGAPFEPVSIAEIRKNSREVIRIALDQFKGSAVIQARCWQVAIDGRMTATRNGLTVSLAHLPAIADATVGATGKRGRPHRHQ